MPQETRVLAFGGDEGHGVLAEVRKDRLELRLVAGREEAPVAHGREVTTQLRHGLGRVALGIEAHGHEAHASRQILAGGEGAVGASQRGQQQRATRRVRAVEIDERHDRALARFEVQQRAALAIGAKQLELADAIDRRQGVAARFRQLVEESRSRVQLR